MAGSAVTPALPGGVSPSTAIGGGGGVGARRNGPSSSELNSYRVSAVIDRFYFHVEGNRSDATEFINLCLSLARGIDFAIANNEVPSRSQELPAVIKQVCQTRNEGHSQAAIMVLMISVKGACQSGWFSNRDSEELYNLETEVASAFGSSSDLKTLTNCSSSIISVIMSRFYPRMKMGHIFALREVKPGFDAYLADFQILKNLKSSPQEKIRLLVVQTDNIETSSCLISPPKVSFLVNGKGVERRTNVSMDNGPQNPTVIMNFLKYGSNLLQAVGEFNGHYLIVVALMSEMPMPDSSALQDYEQHATATVDSEIIEGPSRISLNCPISRQRIKTPVKGCSCNHIQCFDFDNYVSINSRRPSWRCPSCNQHVCFIDLRIDRKMVKVLQEVAADVSDIIIFSDGSWKAVPESDDIPEKPDAVQALQVQTQASPAPPNTYTAVAAQTPSPMTLESSRNNMSTFIPILTSLQANPATPNIPTTVPAQSPTPVINQSNKNSVNAFISSSFSPVSQSSPGGPNTSTPLPINPRRVSHVSLPALHQQHVQRNQFLPNQSHLQNADLQNRGQAPNAYRISNALPGSSQHMANYRTPQPLSQQSSMQSSREFLSPQSHVNIRGVNVLGVHTPIPQHVQLKTAANRTAQMAIDLSRASPSSVRNNDMPVTSPTGDQRVNVGSSSQPITMTDPSNPSDMDWRPAARMRGALIGQAYLDAYNQFISRPAQQAQGARPVPNVTSLPADAPVSMLGNGSSAGMASRTPGLISFPNSHPVYNLDNV